MSTQAGHEGTQHGEGARTRPDEHGEPPRACADVPAQRTVDDQGARREVRRLCAAMSQYTTSTGKDVLSSG